MDARVAVLGLTVDVRVPVILVCLGHHVLPLPTSVVGFLLTSFKCEMYLAALRCPLVLR
jgi:hypothetical protein